MKRVPPSIRALTAAALVVALAAPAASAEPTSEGPVPAPASHADALQRAIEQGPRFAAADGSPTSPVLGPKGGYSAGVEGGGVEGGGAEDGDVDMIAKPARGVDRSRLSRAAEEQGFRLGRPLAAVGWTRLQIPAERAERVAEALKRAGLVERIGLDVPVGPAAVPNDPHFGSQWGLNNTGQTIRNQTGVAGADIGAVEAWDTGTGSSDVVVAVVDTGIQIAHPDLSANIWTNPGEIAGNGIDDDVNGLIDDVNGWDFANGDATVYDPGELDSEGRKWDGHGTHVAGTIAAVGDNGVGVSGVVHHARVMPLKILSPTSGAISDAIDAITYATDHGASVVNHSWAANHIINMYPDTIAALSDAMDYAAQAGVINVCAAGNHRLSTAVIPVYPASIDTTNVISVAASDNRDAFAYFSNIGPDVDLAAPGYDVLSTFADTTPTYAYMSGTSMAAPHVTGAVALLRSLLPTASAEELRSRVEDTVDRPAGLWPWVRTGRLDVSAALRPFAATPTRLTPSTTTLVPALEATATWEVPGYTAPDATYTLQLGTARTLESHGFESGLSPMTGFESYPPFTLTSDHVHEGAQAAISADIGDGEASDLRHVVEVPAQGGELRFWHWLDSEDGKDWAYLLVDGFYVWEAAGDRPWTEVRVPLPAGTHELRWEYVKNESTSQGLDAFGIDDVSLVAYDWSEVGSGLPGLEATFTVPSPASEEAALRVRGERAGRASNWTLVDRLVVGDETTPTVPTGLEVVKEGNREVGLRWDASSEPDHAGWQLWRASGTDQPVKVATLTEPSYVDRTAQNGVQYTYHLVARDTSGNQSDPSATVTATPRVVYDRLFGDDRYLTAIEVSKASFDSAATVVLATGESFPDALSASALAGAHGGPLLLTPRAKLPKGLLTELSRLGADDVVIVGGTAAVSADVESGLTKAGYDVGRVQGSDRYETAEKVAYEVRRLGWGGEVFVARGDEFPDALAASPLAYVRRNPVLLVKPTAIPRATGRAIDSLDPVRAIVLGSDKAVSSSVQSSLGVPTKRVQGPDRYATAAAVAVYGEGRGWVSFDAVGLATGQSFPDALGGGAALGARGGVLLLTPTASLSSSVKNEVSARSGIVDEAYVVGGTPAISSSTAKAFRALLP